MQDLTKLNDKEADMVMYPEIIEPEGRLVEEVADLEDGKILITVATSWEVFEIILSPGTRTRKRLKSLSVGDPITIVVHRDYFEDDAFDVLI